MTEVMKRKKCQSATDPKAATLPRLTLPQAMLVLGVLIIGASFLPLGSWAARSQWTREDSAAYDKICSDYKASYHLPAARRGLSEAEWQAQREDMRLQMEALQQKLDRAKSQPKRWSRYLLGIGSLLTAAGFFAHSSQSS